MISRVQALSTVLFAGLWLSVACGDDDEAGPSSSGGTAPTAGTSSEAGDATTPGKGGSGGKSGSQAGSAGKTSSGATSSGATTSVGGAGGEPASPCPGCDSGFCLDDGTCVDCSPKNDRCPAGQYCTDDNECAKGCKDDDSCASGSCGKDHGCERCINDDECTGDDVCQNGNCGPICGEGGDERVTCDGGLTCCSAHCTDTLIDSNHCGACGSACGDGQFCGQSKGAEGGGGAGNGGAGGAGPQDVTCHDVTLANLCAISKVIVILDTNKNDSDGNRAPGRAMGAALEGQCQPTPVVTEEEQDSVSALNFTTGRPVSHGGELLLVAGGSYYQNLEGYVEQSISPLYVKVVDGKQQFMSRGEDRLVARDSNDNDNDSHDYFAMQFIRDAASGSLVLNLQGFWLSGTQAGTFYFVNGVLPDLASFDQAWYVYEWTDANDDKKPDLDEIERVDSGS